MILKRKVSETLVSADKRGQLFGLSFQMIFSIFLIIIFVAGAGIAGSTLMKNAEHARIIRFIQELNSEIEKVWMTTSAEKTITLDLPSKIKYVCLIEELKDLDSSDYPVVGMNESFYFYSDEYEDSTVFFYDPDVLESYDMTPYIRIKCGTNKKDCLNLDEINNICCIENKKGVIFTLKKDIGNPDVIFVPNNCI